MDTNLSSRSELPAGLSTISREIDQKQGGKARQSLVLTSSRSLPVVGDMAQTRPSPFPGKPDVVLVQLDHDAPGAGALGGTATAAQSGANTGIMSNPSLLRSFALRIAAACPTVASVKFNWRWWTEGFSSDGSGNLRKDQCIHPSKRPSGPRWGENFCKY
jgi:hypothetical protein